MNSGGFTKLFGTITTSSVWVEDSDTLRVWVAMLALCDATGYVPGSVPGMASLCRMSIEQFEARVAILAGPDPYSRTEANEGRRIEVVPGGWRVVNYLQYREKGQDKAGSRARYMRDRRNGVTRNTTLQTSVTRSIEAEAEASSAHSLLEARAPDGAGSLPLSGVQDSESQTVHPVREPARKAFVKLTPADGFADWYAAYPRHVAKLAAERAYRTALKRASADVLLAGAKRYAVATATTDPDKIKHPATWLNGGCWEDERAGPRASRGRAIMEFGLQLKAQEEAS